MVGRSNPAIAGAVDAAKGKPIRCSNVETS
jgi:hypothetical protein